MIPNKIHQTFSKPSELPEKLIDSIRNLKQINPSYQYTLYDDSERIDYILTHYDNEILECYLKINKCYGAARADFFRYLVMYREGGVYLDIKSSCTRPLEEVILPTDTYLLSQWDNGPTGKYPGFGLYHKELQGTIQGGEWVNWFIISEPRHPFLSETIELVLRRIKGYSVFRRRGPIKQILYITGPIAYTQAIEPIRKVHNHRIADAEKDLGLIYTIYDKQDEHRKNYTSYHTNNKPLIKTNPLTEALFSLVVRYKRHYIS